MELKEIRRKIGSVGNIRELTAALETLSALKMKKSQKTALLSRPFASAVSEVLKELEPILAERKSVFLQERAGKKILFFVLASDRGFCGPFNQNILRLSEREIEGAAKEAREIEIFPVGKKAISFFKKKGAKINFSFSGAGGFAELSEVKTISDFLIRAFLENKFQKIYVIWSNFISTFSQKPKMVQLLPLKKENLQGFIRIEADGGESGESEFLIEPSLEKIADEVIPQLIEYLVYQCVLENNASEHSSRMVAMKNASDNARDRLAELRLDYNKARQNEITREVAEISSTKEVLE